MPERDPGRRSFAFSILFLGSPFAGRKEKVYGGVPSGVGASRAALALAFAFFVAIAPAVGFEMLVIVL